MDREQQIEITSFEHLFVNVDNIKHIRYVLKAIIDKNQYNVIYNLFMMVIISKEDFFNKRAKGRNDKRKIQVV
jgi:hypothetical protein